MHSDKDKPRDPRRPGESPEHGSLARLTDPDSSQQPLQVGARLRNYFLTGLIIVGPVTITLWIVLWFIQAVDGWVKPLMPDFYAWVNELVPPGVIPDWIANLSIPGLGLIFAIIGLTLVGALAANLLGRTIVSYGEIMLGRLPVVRNVYGATKQIFETVLSESGNTFTKVGLVEFPRKGMWSIVFVAGDTRGEIAARLAMPEPLIGAFLPCTPNPTTGYLIYVARSDIVMLDMKIEEAAKLVISAGLITPEFPAPDGQPRTTLADAGKAIEAKRSRRME